MQVSMHSFYQEGEASWIWQGMYTALAPSKHPIKCHDLGKALSTL